MKDTRPYSAVTDILQIHDDILGNAELITMEEALDIARYSALFAGAIAITSMVVNQQPKLTI